MQPGTELARVPRVSGFVKGEGKESSSVSRHDI